MRLGLAEWGMRDLPVEEHYRLTREFGLKYLELGIGGYMPGQIPVGMGPEWVQTLNGYSKKYDVKTPYMCFGNDFTIEDEKEILEKTDEIIADLPACNEIGVTHIRLFSGFSSHEEIVGARWDLLIQALNKVAKACDKYDMQISIETHGRLEPKGDGVIHHHTTSTDKDAIARLLKDTPQNVGINYDPGNLKPVQNEDVISYLSLIGTRLNYCHLKDWKQLDNGSWIPVAIGDVPNTTIDWKRLLDTIAFDGVFLLEYEQTHDIEDGFKRSLDFISRIADIC